MRDRLLNISFVLLAAALVFFFGEKPIYNWDMIAYMGVAVEYTEHNPQVVHESVYKTLKEEVPAPVYKNLTANIEDRQECFESVSAFENELSFFRAKPLYTFLVFLLHKAGIRLVMATLIPSIIACFFIMLLSYHWLGIYLKKPYAFVIALLIGFLRIISELDRYSTPDALSNLFILLSLYLVATGADKKWIVGSLLLCIVARIDNFIFAAVVVYFIYLSGMKNIGFKLLVLGALAALSVIGIPMLLGDKADWFTKFAFLESLPAYIQHWRDTIYLIRTDLFYIAMILATIFLIWKADKEVKSLLYIIIITISARLVLFPSLQERFFAAYEISVLVMLAYYLGGIFKGLNIQNERPGRMINPTV